MFDTSVEDLIIDNNNKKKVIGVSLGQNKGILKTKTILLLIIIIIIIRIRTITTTR